MSTHDGSVFERICIVLDTSEFRGDHAADVCISLKPLAGETVEGLVKRSGICAPSECIRIRLMRDDSAAPEARGTKP